MSLPDPTVDDMTIRDTFACAALQAIFSRKGEHASCIEYADEDESDPHYPWHGFAKTAYEIAGAMMAERSVRAEMVRNGGVA